MIKTRFGNAYKRKEMERDLKEDKKIMFDFFKKDTDEDLEPLMSDYEKYLFFDE